MGKNLKKSIGIIMSIILILGIIPSNVFGEQKEKKQQGEEIQTNVNKMAINNQTTELSKEDIKLEIEDVELGGSIVLPKTCTYYNKDGVEFKDSAVEFSIVQFGNMDFDDKEDELEESEPTIVNGILNVPLDYKNNIVRLKATSNEFNKEFYIFVKDEGAYTININYCSKYYEYDANSIRINLYNKILDDYINNDITDEDELEKINQELEKVKFAYLSEKYYDEENDIWWVKGKISTFNKGILLIAIENNFSLDQYRTIDLSDKLTSENMETTIYYVNGEGITTSKPKVEKGKYKHMLIELEDNRFKEDKYNFCFRGMEDSTRHSVEKKKIGDKIILDVKYPEFERNISVFCYTLDENQEYESYEWLFDSVLNIPGSQNVTKYTFKESEDELKLQAPYNTNYELDVMNKSICFTYRDDDLFYEDTQESLDGKVKVNVDGIEYDMTYNSKNQRYEYTKTYTAESKIPYYFVVNGEKIIGRFAEEKDENYAYANTYIFNPSILATINMQDINYNQNAVITVKIDNLPASISNYFKIKSIYADLSEIGGNSKAEIDKELLMYTISVKDNIEPGIKNIPIVLTDDAGNEYTTQVSINVVKREIKNGDFDWDEAVIYFMLTDRFYDGKTSNNKLSGDYTYGSNPGLYHGGDFVGVTQKLDYLKDLGINTIWISPIVENIDGVHVSGEGEDDVPFNASFHGYWAEDFKSIEKTFGTKAEFEKLIEEAHNRGIKVMVDVVLNHSGYNTYYNGDFDDMHRFIDEDPNIKCSLYGLPDFMTEIKSVRDKIIGWQTAWMKEFDIDYFRVDTVNNVDNTTWSDFKNQLAIINPDFKLIGEAFNAGYDKNISTLNSGRMDSLLDFDINNLALKLVNNQFTLVEDTMSKRNETINNTATMGNFLSSHDEDGLLYQLINKYGDQIGTNLMKLAATFQITAKGQPVIYYGEEIGLIGQNNYPYQTNRYDFDWSITNEQNSMYVHYKKLLSIRNKYSKIFAKGNRAVCVSNEEAGYEVISRNYNNQNIFVGFNTTDKPAVTKVNTHYNKGTVLYDDYNDVKYTVDSQGIFEITIPEISKGGTAILSELSVVSKEEETSDQSDTDETTEANTGETSSETTGEVIEKTTDNSSFTSNTDNGNNNGTSLSNGDKKSDKNTASTVNTGDDLQSRIFVVLGVAVISIMSVVVFRKKEKNKGHKESL